MVSIQNSTKKEKVNLIFSETVTLPISFIIGISFIGGSITESFNNKFPIQRIIVFIKKLIYLHLQF